VSVSTLQDPDSPGEPLPPISVIDIQVEPEGTA
jgi:hypothetical protein